MANTVNKNFTFFILKLCVFLLRSINMEFLNKHLSNADWCVKMSMRENASQ